MWQDEAQLDQYQVMLDSLHAARADLSGARACGGSLQRSRQNASSHLGAGTEG